MARIALTTLCLGLTAFGCSGTSRNRTPEPGSSTGGNATLVINVHGIRSTSGTMNVGVYRDDGTWLTGDNIAYTRVVPISDDAGTMSITLDELPVGEYAVSLYQDVNADSSLAQGSLGIPTEPWGMSNDAIGIAAPATFEQAAFYLHPPKTTIDIRLRDGLFLTRHFVSVREDGAGR